MSVKRSMLALAFAILPIAGLCAPVQVFIGNLSGSNETPPTVSTSTGFAMVTYSPGDFTMQVHATFSGLTTGDTAAHIHCCFVLPATTAGVATPVPTFTGFPSAVTSGSYDHTFDMTSAASYNPTFVTAQGSIAAALNALLTGMQNGTAYFDIHTSTYPGGEIRSNMTLDTVFADDFE